MMTIDGRDLFLEIATGQSNDSLNGSLSVSDGKQSATAPLDEPPKIEDGVATFTATFDETEANFDWTECDVVTADGVTIFTDRSDRGRKVEDAAWTCIATVELDG